MHPAQSADAPASGAAVADRDAQQPSDRLATKSGCNDATEPIEEVKPPATGEAAAGSETCPVAVAPPAENETAETIPGTIASVPGGDTVQDQDTSGGEKATAAVGGDCGDKDKDMEVQSAEAEIAEKETAGAAAKSEGHDGHQEVPFVDSQAEKTASELGALFQMHQSAAGALDSDDEASLNLN